MDTTAAMNIPIPPGPMASMADHGGLPHRPTAAEGPDFERILHSIRGEGTEEPARKAAEELVAVCFLEPLMKMARDNPFKSDLFHGGQGEEAFGGRLDQQLVRGMTEGMNLPLVDAVHDQLTAPKGFDRHG